MLLFITVLSLLLLFFSFLLVYSKVERRTKTKISGFIIAYLLMAYPVLSTVYGELQHPSFDASAGLGMSFLFTWVLTAVIFVFSMVFRYKRQEEVDIIVYSFKSRSERFRTYELEHAD
jgi:quinol-cytochrome oxidoreductase complex cytochrome b subunit